jgi:hypothetical protein
MTLYGVAGVTTQASTYASQYHSILSHRVFLKVQYTIHEQLRWYGGEGEVSKAVGGMARSREEKRRLGAAPFQDSKIAVCAWAIGLPGLDHHRYFQTSGNTKA